MVAVIPEEATETTLFLPALIIVINRLIKNVFPAPPGASRKNNCSVSEAEYCA